MIWYERVESLPADLLAQVQEEDDVWRLLKTYIVRMSRAHLKFVAYEDHTPLFGIGAAQMNLLTPECEVWMVRTAQLRIEHLRDLRPLFREFIAAYRGNRMTARAAKTNRRDRRFIEFFGGVPLTEDATTIIYRIV